MNLLDHDEAMSASGGVNPGNSPSLVGIGVPVDSLPMPIDPVSLPELL